MKELINKAEINVNHHMKTEKYKALKINGRLQEPNQFAKKINVDLYICKLSFGQETRLVLKYSKML